LADELHTTQAAGPVEVRDATRRELGLRIVPWDTIVDTPMGAEMFARGAFADVDPASVRLRLDHQDPPTGIGLSLDERDDGAEMTFRVARTARGDEQLALIADGVEQGASVGFSEVPGGTTTTTVAGRRVRVHSRVALREVSTTWRPAYAATGVMFVRSDEEGAQTMPEMDVAPATPEVDLTPVTAAIERMTDRVERIEERQRSEFVFPTAAPDQPKVNRGEWMSTVLKLISGERVPEMQVRALSDLVTADNYGVVPDAYLTELIGVIDPSRPFLSSTRRMDLPSAGMSLVVPKLVTRPTAAVQAAYGDESLPEKGDVASRATSITNVSYDAITIAGGGDISLQLLKRSSPSYLGLFLELLAEAYAQNAEAEGLAALLASVGQGSGVNDGGVIDPENLILGDAWASGAAVRKRIDTMWLSSAGVAAFIDAKATDTNMPLYSNIQAGFTAGSGPAGTISGLRPIWVPALDAAGYDVVVGPASGFGWTEDGTYTLQVDVPSKAGRDVALVGILWFATMYPTAFTAYSLSA